MAKRKKTKDTSEVKHNLIPKHTKLSETAKKAVLKKFDITIKELPKIKADDPAIRAMGLKEGDIVKIERDTEGIGKTEYYRGVINA